MERFLTLESFSDTEEPPVYCVKKSRFTANCEYTVSEAEAVSFLQKIRAKYPDASHHAYAYRIAPLERCSDAGEPNGTAGMPILMFLKGADLQNCVAVVTRYFGGILLGAGGLARAYKNCALTLSDRITEKIAHRMHEITVGYSCSGKLRHELTQTASCETYLLHEITFDQNVHFKVSATRAGYESLTGLALDASNGEARISDGCDFYVSRRP